MRFGAGVMLVGVWLLASCGKAPEAGNRADSAASVADMGTRTGTDNMGNAANAATDVAPPRTAGAADEESIRAAIDGVYAAYATPAGPTASPRVSPDFKAALDQADKADDMGLGYDPWCECQDFDPARFTHVVKAVQFAPDGDHARAAVTLGLGFADDATVRKWIAFVRTPKGWLIDDLSHADGQSLKAHIRATPAAPAPANAAE